MSTILVTKSLRKNYSAVCNILTQQESDVNYQDYGILATVLPQRNSEIN